MILIVFGAKPKGIIGVFENAKITNTDGLVLITYRLIPGKDWRFYGNGHAQFFLKLAFKSVFRRFMPIDVTTGQSPLGLDGKFVDRVAQDKQTAL